MYWLAQGQNAAAVQAVAAIVVAVFTVVLIGLNGWYASVTKDMAKTMRQQLSSAFQPFISIEFAHHFQGKSYSEGVHSEEVFNAINLTNKSASPIKLVALRVFIYLNDPRFYDKEAVIDQSGLLLGPDETKRFDVTIAVQLGATGVEYQRVLVVHCTDLSGFSEHSFKCEARPKHAPLEITHTFGFYRPASWLTRLIGRIRGKD